MSSWLKSVARAVRPYRPVWLRQQRAIASQYEAFLDGRGAAIEKALKAMPSTRTALLVGYDTVKLATFQTPILCALRMAGFRTVVLASSSRGATAEFYHTLGVATVLGTEAIEATILAEKISDLAASVRTQQDILDLRYEGISIGKFVVSTLMRRLRVGSVDPSRREVADPLKEAIAASIRAVDVARHAVNRYKPNLVSFFDRGYTPDGELFEVALAAGAGAFTLNGAHRGGLIMSKRYGLENKDRHFAAPSPGVWERLRSMEWRETEWNTLRTEIEQSYRSGTWYDEVGTQFNKKVLDRELVTGALGLDRNKKVAVVFPHLFWDATFFWGDDLFRDYNDWFCQTIKAAAENDRLNWIIKVHPAGLVKDIRDGYRGESSEMIAIRETLGSLPDHIKLVAPDSPISTFSLFDIMDYCLTVRGTIGIEAAAFGASVLTAGTGRYDGYGFTIDSGSREVYLNRLAMLETIPPPTQAQIELARRYAYGLFLVRPLKLDTVKFRYLQDDSASLQIELDLKDGRDLVSCRDLRILSSWLASSAEEDLVGGAIDEGPRAACA